MGYQDDYIRQLQSELAKQNAINASKPRWTDFRDLRTGTARRPGLLQTPYRLEDPTIGERVGVDLIREEATREGPSKWRQLWEAEQGDIQAKRQAGEVAQAQNQLAMRGGLRGGAAERIMAQAAQQGLANTQGVARAGMQADEQRRMQMTGMLPGAEMQEAQFQRGTQEYNINQALAQETQKRAADLMKYREDMRAWASERTAAATPSSSGGKK